MVDDTLQQDIECSAVSELNSARASEIGDDTLLLVSVPGYDTETGYMSKFLKFDDLVSKLREDLKLPVEDYWLVNTSGFKQIHVVDGLISDTGEGKDDYWLVDQTKTRHHHVVNGKIVE